MPRLKFPKRTKKTPKRMRYVGMEIECLTNHEVIDVSYNTWGDSIYDLGALGAAKKFALDIHEDGSISGNGTPMEVVTQPLLESRKTAIKSLCKKLKSQGGFVNASCGGHIHVDAKDMVKYVGSDKETTMLKFLTLCEPALYAVTGKRRLDNDYCRPLAGEIVKDDFGEKEKESIEFAFGDRYWSVNLSALEDHGTIEFRLFAGTLEPDKWIARAAFAEAVVNKLKKVIENPKLLKKMHENSALKDFKLESLLDYESKFDKSDVYKKLIKSDGPGLIKSVGKMVGLHRNHVAKLVEQHSEIWKKYEKKS